MRTLLLVVVSAAISSPAALAFTCSPPTSSAAPAACSSLLDVGLVVDNSASVQAVVPSITSFIAAFVSNFALSDDAARFSLVSFGHTAATKSTLTSNTTALLVPRGDQGAATNIAGALTASRQTLLTGDGARVAATKVMLLLTDGDHTVGPVSAAVAVAAGVKAAGIQLFAIGFGDANANNLESMASSPAASYAFLTHNISGVLARTSAIASLACTRVTAVCVLAHDCSAAPAVSLAVYGEGCVPQCRGTMLRHGRSMHAPHSHDRSHLLGRVPSLLPGWSMLAPAICSAGSPSRAEAVLMTLMRCG